MKKLIFAIIFTFCSSLLAADYSEGVDYKVLKTPVKTTTGDNIEVRELFWYYCPHCYNLEPQLEGWIKNNKPDNVSFIAQPAIPQGASRWKSAAALYYTIEELGLKDELHWPIYKAIHQQKKRFSKKSFINWVAGFGVEKQKVKKAYDSFAVKVKINRAALNTKLYGINSVPSMVVNGKYVISGKSNNEMLKIIDFLIKKESK
jgi:thiol:disulfide interchange protein DsbA